MDFIRKPYSILKILSQYLKYESWIYRITNKVNGNCYIGSSVDLQRRRRQHFNNLANDIHINSHLQNAYNKYGDTSLEFEIIEYIEIDDNIKETLLEREQFWIDTINPEYNILPIAGSTLGFKHSEETKQKISNSTKGVKKSKLHAQHIREAQKGKQLTDEHRKKLSELLREGNLCLIILESVLMGLNTTL